MKYKVERTVFDFPWRYKIYMGAELVALTVTKWGAKRLIRKAKKYEARTQRVS